jgi:hypothetical protein
VVANSCVAGQTLRDCSGQTERIGGSSARRDNGTTDDGHTWDINTTSSLGMKIGPFGSKGKSYHTSTSQSCMHIHFRIVPNNTSNTSTACHRSKLLLSIGMHAHQQCQNSLLDDADGYSSMRRAFAASEKWSWYEAIRTMLNVHGAENLKIQHTCSHAKTPAQKSCTLRRYKSWTLICALFTPPRKFDSPFCADSNTGENMATWYLTMLQYQRPLAFARLLSNKTISDGTTFF